MPTYIENEFATATVVLASAVANSGTFTVAYPAGFNQGSFIAGNQAVGGAYMIVNDNDEWTEADSKMSVTYGASDITVTNSTGGTLAAGSKVQLFFDIDNGNDSIILTLPLPAFSAIANGDVVTEIRPGVNGFIEHAEVVVTTPVTTASRAATLNFEIGTTNCTGGTIAMTSANMTPLGTRVASTAFTANNRLFKNSALSVEASSVTAFAEGAGYLLVRIRKI